jgi:hypothetical protein
MHILKKEKTKSNQMFEFVCEIAVKIIHSNYDFMIVVLLLKMSRVVFFGENVDNFLGKKNRGIALLIEV